MGHFFSRAIKRFTQCRNQLPSQEQQEANQQQAQQQQREIESRPIVQSIQVGQSIDSAEYAAFEIAREVKKSQPSGPSSSRLAQIQEKDTTRVGNNNSSKRDDKENEVAGNDGDDSNQAQNTPQVEEAVIKIQALVRGHLTRKALKDAQQQAATPAPNALGQSQFDEESLIKNPPNAVLSPSSPLNTTTNTDLFNDQVQKIGGSSTSSPAAAAAAARVPPLESIAEETTTSANDPNQPSAQITTDSGASPNRRKLSPINRSIAISTESRSDSMSPALSEANASIDLTCETPASASIDILDHNIRATDALASVLHHKLEPTVAGTEQQIDNDQVNSVVPSSRRSPRMIVEPPTAADQQQQTIDDGPESLMQQQQSRPSNMIANSHSIDSAEAAAIRIQSAYRGYHTRKNSPYRRRSPGTNSTSPPAMSLDNGIAQYCSTNCTDSPARVVLRQQENNLDEVEADEELLNGAGSGGRDIATAATETVDRLTQALREGRRQSRQRHRSDDVEVNPDTTNLQSADEITTTTTTNEDQNTVRESGGPPARSQTATLEDENSDATRISLAALDTVESIGDNQLSHKAAEVVAAAAAAAAAARQAPQTGVDNFSFELDTESSNLGAALSFNEDISEAVAKSFEETRQPDEDRSYGANLISDEQASEARRLVEQLTNEDDEEEEEEEEAKDKEAFARQSQQGQSLGNQDAALQEATDELEAALEEATDDLDDNVAENLANAILDEDEQRNIEMESDDIERRDPSGLVSEDRAKSPQIRTTDQQPALVSGGSSIEEEVEGGDEQEEQRERQEQRLAVESPDEAIGSGRSSPALISSNGGGSSDDEEEEGEGEAEVEDKQVKTTDGASSGGRQQPGGGNKNSGNKKKNRNRKKARK